MILKRNAPLSEREITGHLSEIEQPPTTSKNSLSTELIHTHLPILEEAGLIRWNRDGAVVHSAPHPAFDDPRFRLLLEAKATDLDAALSNLAVEHRRILVTVLRDAHASLTRRDLARELLRSKDTDLEPNPDAVDDEILSLYHVHLPALAEAELIEYDRENGRARYTDHPALEEVFTIIYDPDERLVDSCNGFLEGMKGAFDELKRGTGVEAEWPHFWRTPSHD